MASRRTERLLRGMNKDTRAVVRRCVRDGWTLDTTGSGHVRLTHPSGRSITTASTTGNRFSRYALERNIKQIEQGEATT